MLAQVSARAADPPGGGSLQPRGLENGEDHALWGRTPLRQQSEETKGQEVK